MSKAYEYTCFMSRSIFERNRRPHIRNVVLRKCVFVLKVRVSLLSSAPAPRIHHCVCVSSQASRPMASGCAPHATSSSTGASTRAQRHEECSQTSDALSRP